MSAAADRKEGLIFFGVAVVLLLWFVAASKGA